MSTDPVGAAMNYALCGIPLRLDCRTASAGRSLGRALQALFPLIPRASTPSDCGLEVRIGYPADEPVLGEIVYRAPEICVLRTARGYHLRTRTAFLSLDLKAGRAAGALSDAFLTAPLEVQRSLWLFALPMLLSARGLYALHAGGVVSPEGHGVLLAGVSGSGKTTLTCALTRSGWSYLSDDSVLLEDTPEGVQALAFGRSFHCAAPLFGHYPELCAGSAAPQRGKRLVEAASLYPGQSRERALPRAVFFPEIVAEEETRAIPLSATETLLRLLANAAAKLHGRAAMAAQMAALTQLASSARGYRLLHGADVHRHPERVAALLRRCADAQGERHELNSAA